MEGRGPKSEQISVKTGVNFSPANSGKTRTGHRAKSFKLRRVGSRSRRKAAAWLRKRDRETELSARQFLFEKSAPTADDFFFQLPAGAADFGEFLAPFVRPRGVD